MKAIISPTCMVPRSTPWAPAHTISTEMPFIISIITGIIMDMVRLVNSWVLIRSRLALSKRFSSYSSRLKARITLRPVRISRETRFTRSIRVCIFLNLGMATAISTTISASSTPTATAMIQPMPVRVVATRTMPPMPIIGA